VKKNAGTSQGNTRSNALTNTLSIQETAEALGISCQAVHKRIKAGTLDARLENHRWNVSRSSVEYAFVTIPHAGRPYTAKRYILMNAQHPVLSFSYQEASGSFTPHDIFDAARAPMGTITRNGKGNAQKLKEWWDHRCIPESREHMDAKLRELGVERPSLIPFRNLGFSLSDQYWVCPEGETLRWEDLNYFDNPFGTEDMFAVPYRTDADKALHHPCVNARQSKSHADAKVDQSDLDATFQLPISNAWSHIGGPLVLEAPNPFTKEAWTAQVGLASPDNTSEGALPKRWICLGDQRVLLKGHVSWSDQQAYNEVVATALYRRILGSHDYVPYVLASIETAANASVSTADASAPMPAETHANASASIYANVPASGSPQNKALLASACPCFVQPNEEYVTAAAVLASLTKHRGETDYDAIVRAARNLGMSRSKVVTWLAKMIVCDTILANTDRHFRNFGFIKNVETLSWEPAPLFDSGNCLWFEADEEAVARNDFSYTARPFGPTAVKQLGFVEDFSWLDMAALDGFADEAVEILAESNGAMWRLDFIKRGIENQINLVKQCM